MLKYIVSFLGIIIFSIWGLTFGNNLDALWPTKNLNKILTESDTKIIPPQDADPMREWVYRGVVWTEKKVVIWISESGEKIDDHEDATKRTVETIQRLINWALWLLALAAMLVVIFGGIQMLTAAWDDWKFKNWKKAIKKASIGIIWVALSWIIVSFIFWLVETFIE